jgi:myosin heavy subunit
MEVERLKAEIQRMAVMVEEAKELGEEQLFIAKSEWRNESLILNVHIQRLTKELDESERIIAGLRAGLDPMLKEYKMRIQQEQEDARESEARNKDIISKLQIEISVLNEENLKAGAELSKLQVMVGDLEHDRREYTWLTDKLRMSAEFSKSRRLVGWESEMRVEAFDIGSKRLQEAATDVASLIKSLHEERNLIVSKDEEMANLKKRLAEVEEEFDVLESEADRHKLELEVICPSCLTRAHSLQNLGIKSVYSIVLTFLMPVLIEKISEK